LGDRGAGDRREADCLLCVPCIDRKTNGAAATTYGSDKHEIAKAKRLQAASMVVSCGLKYGSQAKAALPARARRIAQQVSAMPMSAGRVTAGKSRAG
jgi:hypothetical protein